MAKEMWKGLDKLVKEGKVVPGGLVYLGSASEIRREQKMLARKLERDRKDYERWGKKFYLD